MLCHGGQETEGGFGDLALGITFKGIPLVKFLARSHFLKFPLLPKIALHG